MAEQADKTQDKDTGAMPDADSSAMTSDELQQIQHALREGDIEIPSGAEDIIEAFRMTLTDRDEWHDRFVQLGADYQNFQRRAANNEREARAGATTGVVQSLLPIMDQFDLALDHIGSGTTAEQIASGVSLIREEFQRVLGNYGITRIEPSPGDEFNPSEHEAILHIASEEVKPGHIVKAVGFGYRLGDRIVRPAKVMIAKGSED